MASNLVGRGALISNVLLSCCTLKLRNVSEKPTPYKVLAVGMQLQKKLASHQPDVCTLQPSAAWCKRSRNMPRPPKDGGKKEATSLWSANIDAFLHKISANVLRTSGTSTAPVYGSTSETGAAPRGAGTEPTEDRPKTVSRARGPGRSSDGGGVVEVFVWIAARVVSKGIKGIRTCRKKRCEYPPCVYQ